MTRIQDISVHEKGEARWIGLPVKPQLGRDGAARKDASGKIQYAPVLEFTDAKTRDAFGRRVIAALLEFAPAAFELEEA